MPHSSGGFISRRARREYNKEQFLPGREKALPAKPICLKRRKSLFPKGWRDFDLAFFSAKSKLIPSEYSAGSARDSTFSVGKIKMFHVKHPLDHSN
ncbi:MAG: hypothetical protein A2157_11085 [Deltaproteobacteria bacterium RBG_16_47_11]|nr:MAG: hypothetical protein A2157_11085 [Deltaproteobacteria bacterium RBG_16_47_11]